LQAKNISLASKHNTAIRTLPRSTASGTCDLH